MIYGVDGTTPMQRTDRVATASTDSPLTTAAAEAA
jgi:hypothetical protein